MGPGDDRIGTERDKTAGHSHYLVSSLLTRSSPGLILGLTDPYLDRTATLKSQVSTSDLRALDP